MDKEQTRPTERDDRREPGEDPSLDAAPLTPDPNDEIPVPVAMFPSEIDERAQVVEALREEANTKRDDDLGVQP
jgi:hypothetical protein